MLSEFIFGFRETIFIYIMILVYYMVLIFYAHNYIVFLLNIAYCIFSYI